MVVDLFGRDVDVAKFDCWKNRIEQETCVNFDSNGNKNSKQKIKEKQMKKKKSSVKLLLI